MTVKCVDAFEKDVIVDLYRFYGHSVTKLATDFQVSRKTIYRILAEQGITFNKPEPKPEPQPTNFLQRMTNAIRRKVSFLIPATQ